MVAHKYSLMLIEKLSPLEFESVVVFSTPFRFESVVVFSTPFKFESVVVFSTVVSVKSW